MQGPDNGLAIEGGMTLGYEMIAELMRRRTALDRLFVQVGGGALASACIQAWRDARALGLVERLPRFHTVQTASAHPLQRAHRRLVERIAPRSGIALDDYDSAPGAISMRIAAPDAAPARAEALRHAGLNRAQYMWPWVCAESANGAPHSIATGILDDETYDWHAVCAGMLDSGGTPLVVDEAQLAEANRAGCDATGIDADPTGTAGLAGALACPDIDTSETVAVLFTGARR